MNVSQQMLFRSRVETLLERRPERLFVSGLRCILTGYQFADIECWETAWRIYADELGIVTARKLLAEVQFFARTVQTCAAPPLSVFPYGCRRLSHDESKALNLTVCLQHDDRAAAEAAAAMLVADAGHNGSQIDALLQAGRVAADAFTSEAMFFVPLGRDTLDRLTGHSNTACADCPVTRPVRIVTTGGRTDP